jgi:hypothetical protein
MTNVLSFKIEKSYYFDELKENEAKQFFNSVSYSFY